MDEPLTGYGVNVIAERLLYVLAGSRWIEGQDVQQIVTGAWEMAEAFEAERKYRNAKSDRQEGLHQEGSPEEAGG